MRIKHRIVKNFTDVDQIALKSYGIKINIGWDSFEIFSDEQDLNEIKNYFASDWDKITSKEIEFTEDERSESKYLNIYANKYLGYAMPDTGKEVENFEFPFNIYPYYKDVFEVKATDKEFGMLKGKQIGSYKMKGEPKWGKAKIGSLHYAEDDFFVTPDIYKSIFKPLGIESLPVLDFKTLKPLKTILQIVHLGISESKLIITNGYVKEIQDVKSWHLRKFILREDTPFPLYEQTPGNLDLFYTQEYFGSGGLTQRSSIITHKLYKILKENKVLGLNYTPLLSFKNNSIQSYSPIYKENLVKEKPFRTFEGKDYTQEEWEKYEANQWKKFKDKE